MIVMRVAYDNLLVIHISATSESRRERMTYTINDWNIRDVARLGCEPFMAYPGEWRTTVFEYGIKEKP